MKVLICFVILISLGGTQTPFSNSVEKKPLEDSRELQLQDMLVLILLPHMQDKLEEVYSNAFSVPGQPDIYPYFVNVKHTERVNGFRGFDLLITLDVHPTIGPHIPVGEDIFTYRISPFGVELKEFEHLRGPNKNDVPPNYQDLLK